MKSTYGLEYALFFGVPGNKVELIHGTSRWAFPFLSRAEAEVHFQDWLETLRRWKQVDGPTPIRKSDKIWRTEVGGIRMELFPRRRDRRQRIIQKAIPALADRERRRRNAWFDS